MLSTSSFSRVNVCQFKFSISLSSFDDFGIIAWPLWSPQFNTIWPGVLSYFSVSDFTLSLIEIQIYKIRN